MAFKKIRNLKVCCKSEIRQKRGWMAGTDYISVPAINLKGLWLKELGFDISTPVKVECEEEKLVITKVFAETTMQ